LYGSTTVSDTLGEGKTENVSIIRSGYSSLIFEIRRVPIPDPVPPPREWHTWKPDQSKSKKSMSCNLHSLDANKLHNPDANKLQILDANIVILKASGNQILSFFISIKEEECVEQYTADTNHPYLNH